MLYIDFRVKTFYGCIIIHSFPCPLLILLLARFCRQNAVLWLFWSLLSSDRCPLALPVVCPLTLQNIPAQILIILNIFQLIINIGQVDNDLLFGHIRCIE
jgi:hypothetical protein